MPVHRLTDLQSEDGKGQALTFDPGTKRGRDHASTPNLARAPAEIDQGGIGTDDKQLTVQIGIENFCCASKSLTSEVIDQPERTFDSAFSRSIRRYRRRAT